MMRVAPGDRRTAARDDTSLIARAQGGALVGCCQAVGSTDVQGSPAGFEEDALKDRTAGEFGQDVGWHRPGSL